MGSAYYETKGIIRGSAAELSALKEALLRHVGERDGVYFLDCSVEKQDGDEIRFSASGPYGSFSGLDEVPIFINMAEKAPFAFFDIEVSGNTDFTDDEMRCKLSDGKLCIEMETDDISDAEDAYKKYFTEKLPFEKFAELFMIKTKADDGASYESFIGDLSWEAGVGNDPFEVSPEYFFECLEVNGWDTALSEENFDAAKARAKEPFCLSMTSGSKTI